MNKIFTFIEWFNENHTAEEFLSITFLLVIAGGGVASILYSVNVAIFLVGIGSVILLNLYIVTHIQRWYVARTQEKMKDFDYSQIVDTDETAE